MGRGGQAWAPQEGAWGSFLVGGNRKAGLQPRPMRWEVDSGLSLQGSPGLLEPTRGPCGCGHFSPQV